MKTFYFILLATIGLIGHAATASALELHSYKSNVATVNYTDAQVESMWTSKTPACIKDGSKIIGVNQAFKTANLGYRDCSSSKNALRKQELTGVAVKVFKVTELSSKLAKQVLGIK